MGKSVQVRTATGRTVFVATSYAKRLMRKGLAICATQHPFVIILTEKLYCPEYEEEQRYLKGRMVEVTRTKTLCKNLTKNTSATSGNTRIRPSRSPMADWERQFRADKARYFLKKEIREQARVQARQCR